MKKALFITLEGPDGCGKSTQSKLLAESLRRKGLRVLHTREPGGTPFTESLREVILNPRFRIDPLTEILLYEASRAQHTAEVIRPALREGQLVICDRYFDATTAYQGYGRKLDLRMVRELNRIASGGLTPDLTLCLDVPPELGLRRARHRKKDRLEREEITFHARVRKGYLAIAKAEPGRVKVIPGSGTIEEVQGKIWAAVMKKLGKKNV